MDYLGILRPQSQVYGAKAGVFDREIKGSLESWRELEQVVLLEVDLLIQSLFVGFVAAIFDRRRGEIHSDHLKTMLGQVKRFVAVSTAGNQDFSG